MQLVNVQDTISLFYIEGLFYNIQLDIDVNFMLYINFIIMYDKSSLMDTQRVSYNHM